MIRGIVVGQCNTGFKDVPEVFYILRASFAVKSVECRREVVNSGDSVESVGSRRSNVKFLCQ